MKRFLVLPCLLALCAAPPAAAQAFPPDAWLVRERTDARTGEDTSIAVLGARVDPLGNDGAIALRCSAGSEAGFEAFVDFDAFHGNDGRFEVDASWGGEPAVPLSLAPSVDRTAGFVTGAAKAAFVRDLRSHDRLVVRLRDEAGATTTWIWRLPVDSGALDRLACLP